MTPQFEACALRLITYENVITVAVPQHVPVQKKPPPNATVKLRPHGGTKNPLTDIMTDLRAFTAT